MLISRYKILGHSMESSVFHGEAVLVSNIPYWFREPKKDDIVIFFDKKSNKKLLKRIKDVKNGNYFLIGDNINDSRDSRAFGYVQRSQILGKVIFKID